jgi:hypothetical protein
MIGERSLSGVLYYQLARVYPSAGEAARVFDRLKAEGTRSKGRRDLGVYRAAHADDPAEARVLLIVSLSRAGIEWAANEIGGESYERVAPHEWDSLMQRRVRVVEEIRQAGMIRKGGHVRIPHGGGAKLRPGGLLDEPRNQG